MARRAVQSACLDLGADPTKTLFKQIEGLHGEGELSNRLKALADQVRFFGNDGAHPSSDGLENVSKDDAELAVQFLEHLIQHVFTIDQLIEKGRS